MTAAQANVAEITESEIPEVAAFLARQARPGEPVGANPLPPAERLRWLLLENPARISGIPLGWRIRAIGGVVGAAICVPFRIGAGDFSGTALMFAKFYVDVAFRGMGLGLLMRFVREGERFPLFVTSTNAISGQLFARLGASVIAGMDHTMLGIAKIAPLAEELAFRRLKSSVLARGAGFVSRFFHPRGLGRAFGAVSRGELIRQQSADDLAALQLPPPGVAVAVVRDRDYLHWRYFTRERDKEVWSFRLPGEVDRLAVVNEVRAGHRLQIRVLNVLDVWPPATPVVATALVGQLAMQYRGTFDVIWLRSQSDEVEAALRENGWRRHQFPAPLGWYLDRGNRLPVKGWYLMPGESE
jgi:hypothetical protein